MFKIKLLLAIFFFGIAGYSTYAQSTAMDTDPAAGYNRAVDFYQRGVYALALPVFQHYFLLHYADDRMPYNTEARNCAFYIYDCLLKLDKEQITEEARAFIEQEDPVVRKNQLSYQLAAYYFRRDDFQNSMEYDARAGIEGLNNEQIGISKFRKAYALFHFKRYAEAKPIFVSIIQVPRHPHYADAHYYNGFIAYQDNDYKTALHSFEMVRTNPKYASKVPYYLTSLYFNTGAPDRAVQEGEAALQKADIEFKNDIRRLLGHIYYDRRKYEQALPHLEAYVAAQPKVGRDVYFELHDTYYRLKKYDKAIAGMKQLSGGTDKLSQFAMYILADAYLQTGQKENARNAFSFAANNNSDSLQKEVSFFMYGKLSAELNYQGEAITTLKKFIEDYPQSVYKNEAKELLIGLMAASNNYKEALAMLETIQAPSEQTKKIIPVVKFGRATEMLNDQQLSEAEVLLDEVMQLPYNETVLPLVHYWKGELAYKSGNISAATNFYQLFIKSGHKGQGEANIKSAHYNLGYCYLKSVNYAAALQQFEKAVPSVKQSSTVFEQDGYVRQADGHFMLKQYTQARNIYQKVIDYGWRNADYATFQKAMIAGISSSKTKIDLLKSMETNYPTSSLLGEAVMEIAKTLMSDERFREAIPYLSAVVQSDTSHPYHTEALLQLGIAWYNLDEYDKAITQFNHILTTTPYASAAEEALENLKSIYLETGQPEKYEEQMRLLGREVSASQADSLAFAAVELKLAADDCKGVVQAATQYLKRFPEGNHMIDAWYYQSECYMALKDKERAIKGYVEICSKENNPHMGKAALIVARYYFFDRKDYAAAQPYFELLHQYAVTDDQKFESLRGNLRCLYQMKQYEKGALVARELISMKLASTDDKALSQLIIGRFEQQQLRYDKAITAFKQTVSLNKGEWAAEAGYALSVCFFDQQQYESAEKAAFDVIKKSGSYAYWVTKSYILLGDIFYAQKDYFNARATYQSVADNAKDADLKKEAGDKLARVTEEEQKDSNIIQ
jgi:tetratricopeptide (TPR) repeat protein